MSWFKKAEAWFVKLFSKAPSWDKTASVTLSIVSPLVVGILGIVDPALVPIVNPIITKVQTDLALAATLVEAGAATPTLTGALNDIQTNLASILQLAQVKNSTEVTKITAEVNTIIAEIQAIQAAVPAVESAVASSGTTAPAAA